MTTLSAVIVALRGHNKTDDELEDSSFSVARSFGLNIKRAAQAIIGTVRSNVDFLKLSRQQQ